MKRHQSSDLISSRKSQYYSHEPEAREDPVLVSRAQVLDQLYPRMLVDDLRTGIMPAGGESKTLGLSIKLEPDNSRWEEMLAQGFSLEGRGYRLASSVADLFGDCAAKIAAFERAVYEIVYFTKPDEKKVVRFELVPINPLTISYSRGKYRQHITKAVARRRGIPQSIELDPEIVLYISSPPNLKGTFYRALESLALSNDQVLPDFAIKEMEKKQRIPFDISAKDLRRKLAIADDSKHVGWNARGLFQDSVLEFYFLYRELQFEKTKAQLRMEILSRLNDSLVRIGKVMNFNCKIVIKGLPSIEDIEESQRHLFHGDQSFKDIVARFLAY